MKRMLTILILLLSIGLGSFFGMQYFNSAKPNVTQPIVGIANNNNNFRQPEATVAAGIPQSVINKPTKLIIPKINVNAVTEEVGLDTKNRMDVPKGSMNVAWYNLGYKIGETGNAVIAGHYDKKNGSPEVFYNISKLEIGDQIKVLGENGKELTFKVTGRKTFDDATFPIKEVFGEFNKARLNLITCSGVYDKQSQNYSKRLVIYSELVES